MKDSVREAGPGPAHRIHSSPHKGRLHKGPGMVPRNATIPSRYQTVVTENSEQKGFSGTSKRFQYQENENPAPGYYKVEHKPVLPNEVNYSKKGTGYFASGSQRTPQQVPVVAPAPNKYNVRSAPPKCDYNVGLGRIFKADIAVNADALTRLPGPGPANYKVERVRCLEARQRIGPTTNFTSKARRSELLGGVVGPGPAAYDTSQEPGAFTGAAKSVFVSKSQRTNYGKGEGPGPAEYEICQHPEPVDKLIWPKKHYLCLSAPALPLSPEPSQPGPGHYETLPRREGKRFMASSMFVSNSSRWTGQWRPTGEGPSPAQYNPRGDGKISHQYNARGIWV